MKILNKIILTGVFASLTLGFGFRSFAVDRINCICVCEKIAKMCDSSVVKPGNLNLPNGASIIIDNETFVKLKAAGFAGFIFDYGDLDSNKTYIASFDERTKEIILCLKND